MTDEMKNVYFAGPISVDPDRATEEKKRFLEENHAAFIDADINVHSPHLMYLWLTDIPENTGKGSPPEKFALRSCLNFIEATDLDAIVMLTSEDEESSGMREERELAEELGIPIVNYPYFTQDGEELAINGVDQDELRDLLHSL